MTTHAQIADALAACDWSGVSVGNKAIILNAIDALKPPVTPPCSCPPLMVGAGPCAVHTHPRDPQVDDPDLTELEAFIRDAKEQGHDCEQRLDGTFANIYLNGAWCGWQQRAQYDNPELTVWEGAMPESNGKSNFTAILMRKGSKLWDEDVAITIDRSEYPDRVRYEADRMRYLIGEIDKEPCIIDYDSELHSGYVKPPAPPAAVKLDDEARAEFERMVMGMEHRPYGWLGQEWLDRGDDPYNYASEYVQGLWVMYQITVLTRSYLKSLWDDTGLRCLMRPDQVRRISTILGEKIEE
uniref:Uncharacterized protein n=1 Tax=Pseudomonas phage Cygsa01 TaxID=3138529 RepID=A0AAU6W3U7_9VIRU